MRTTAELCSLLSVGLLLGCGGEGLGSGDDTNTDSRSDGITTLPCAYADPSQPVSSAYPQERAFVESQGWWQDKRTAPLDTFPGRHVHVGACFPLSNLASHPTLSGTIHLDWRVLLHAQPSGTKLEHAFVQIATAAHPSGILVASPTHTVSGQALPLSCTGDCTYWFSADIDTTLSDYDGLEEFRFPTIVREPDGDEEHASAGWQAKLANGKTVNNYRGTGLFEEFRGWYSISSATSGGYQNARLTSSGLSGNVQPTPSQPVPAMWTTYWKLAPGAGGLATTHYECAVDPDYHHGNLGTVVKSGSGSYTGSVVVNTSALTSGAHVLVCRADSDYSATAAAGILSGVAKLPFSVP